MQNADTTARNLTQADAESISKADLTTDTPGSNTGRLRLMAAYGKLYDDIVDDGFLADLSHDALKVYLVLTRFANRERVSCWERGEGGAS